MKRLFGFLSLSLFFLNMWFPTAAQTESRGIHITSEPGQSLYLYKGYHALVVGVSEYEWWPDLPNAVKDAAEVATNLERLGFDVKPLLNPPTKGMKSALTEMWCTG